jgi:hypothetical protein
MFSSINHIEKFGSAKAGHLRAAGAASKNKAGTPADPAHIDSLRDVESEKDSETV